MIVFALAAIVAAVGLVRLGWGGRRGAAPVGWALAAAGLAALAMRDGAWGIAVGTVAGIVTALALVLHAGWCQRPGRFGRSGGSTKSACLGDGKM